MLLAPVVGAIALAIWRQDGWPIFFRQQRVGHYGRDFMLIKFRTMRNAEGVEKGSFDAGDGSRVTPLGRLLRRWKLDELPQLWNVLKGDMSLVGPRPEVRTWTEAYPERWQKVLSVRPGITDPASITFRNEEELLAAAPNPQIYYRDVILPQKLSLYETYVANRSFWGDVVILLNTVKTVVGW